MYRYDVKLAGGKVKLDVAPGKETGVSAQSTVYVYSSPDDVMPTAVLEQGTEEYMLTGQTWFSAPDKTRMLVTEYNYTGVQR